mmetsp:Transcript_118954/g.381142  ORF Transcript_118954/g.381142 Transcript_118954/m.381142 type:complete len:202 (+) Transcript_118954:485-1090(+)
MPCGFGCSCTRGCRSDLVVDNRTSTRQARQPARGRPDTQAAQQLVAEVATIATQQVVVVAGPLGAQAADQAQHLRLCGTSLRHRDRADVGVVVAVRGPAAEDTRASVLSGTKAPLPAIHLHACVVRPSAEGAEHAVGSLDRREPGDTVDVQRDQCARATPGNARREPLPRSRGGRAAFLEALRGRGSAGGQQARVVPRSHR